MEDFLAGLNPPQREAVETTEGYVRVVAGAGTGKTKTLTRRYLYLVEALGISTASILCVTFTNKAAAEMKKRIRQTLPDRDLGRITTFHGFCVNLLKEDCHVAQYPSSFIVLDEEDKAAILKTVFEDLHITSREMTVREAIDYIGWRKGGRGYVKTLIDMGLDRLRRLESTATTLKDKVLYRYFYEQRKCYGLDFDDIVYFALYILREDRSVREKWQKRLEYIMVDEFQDIDKDLYELAEILSGHHRNLFVVGDPDQTIYTWRGADVNFILEFDSKHPGTRTILLDTNYRSTPEILAAANQLIRHNRNRMDKDLHAVRPGLEKPRFYHAKSQPLEANWIASQIRQLAKAGVPTSKIAVLYRSHHVSRAIEEAFIREQIPYVLYSGVEFYKRKEIKDVLCYLRMVASGDDMAFLRTVNEPRRGVGRTRIAYLKEYAAMQGMSLYEALLENLDKELFRRSRAVEYARMIEKYRAIYSSMDLTDLLAGILSDSGYEAMLRLSGEEDRLDNLAELKQAICDYESKAGELVTLEGYLAHAALFTNMDTVEKAAAVKLMTVHAAKGLEFPTVFLCGLSEGIFPTKRANTPEKLEEERRLCYVAFTRAMDRLYLSDASGFGRDGVSRCPSRFLFNAGQAQIDFVEPLDPALLEAARSVLSGEPEPVQRLPFPAGTRVTHQVFGPGTVLLPGEGGVLVQFDRTPTPRTISPAVLTIGNKE